MSNSQITKNLKQVKDQIEVAAKSVGRSVDQVRLVVVTKGHPEQTVHDAIAAGAEILGENYVEEALPKIDSVHGGKDLEWHMIGHVQSRKARTVCEHFNWVQSVDSMRLAKRMDRFAADMAKRVPILLECNVSGEESKYGWSAWNKLEWEEFAEEISPVIELDNLDIRGLMTMPPFFPDAEQARPYFVHLRELRDFLAARFPQLSWLELSMGMSGDFVVAVQEGATIVRIGTAILGERK
jgi:hypothetical protein